MQSDCEACRVAAGFNLFVEGKRGPRGEPIADVSPLVEWIPEPLPNADAIMADVAARKALTGPDHVQQPLTYCRVCDGLHLDDGSPACEVPWAAYD